MPDLTPAAPLPLRRRTVLQATAWTVPAILVTTASPAVAASGDRIAFISVPSTTAACAPTTEVLVLRLSGSSPVAGQLVDLSLTAGWSWGRGGGTYISDADGTVTVPAGDIVAGGTDATLTAMWASARASTTLAATKTGGLSSDRPATLSSLPDADNADMMRLSSTGDTLVAVTSTGVIWSIDGSGSWTAVGTGAASGPDQAAFLVTRWNRAAWWINHGRLFFGGSQASIDPRANSDFVRLYALGAIGVAVRANGDVWKWDDDNGYTLLGRGAATGQSQLAVAASPATGAGSAAVWLRAGVVFVDSAPADLPAGTNEGFERVYSCPGGVAAVTSGGVLWTWTAAAGWSAVGTGAATGAGQATYLKDDVNDGPVWIRNGRLRYRDEWASIPSTTENHDFVSLTGCAGTVLAAKSTGDLWMWNQWPGWIRLTSNVAPGAGQFAYRTDDGDRDANSAYWITPRSSC
ncbi:hypothetical protein M3672_02640 [Microbacterium enclense]|uniref:hypothetical protein n=1 Tax=Microbacterium enclense TaxID=993073 RepID=UPI0020425648|nr:hypothetical protein [Microbacterium enclense]MCM3613332.1 hypothetical protein [Microbacterium enclense]